MNEETILDFIKKGESETIEFKSTLDQAAIETLTAFANTKGGYVFVGVADSGKIVGVQLGNETIPQWNKLVAEAFYLTKDIEKYRTGSCPPFSQATGSGFIRAV
jgi:predicted HTH transcriptional regulator